MYAPKDFLEVVASLVNPNSAAQGEEVAGYWGIVQVRRNSEVPIVMEIFILGTNVHSLVDYKN